MNIFDIINIPLGYIIKICYTIVPNYALALLIFAILMKVLLFPLGIKQQKNSVRQAELRPREMAIRNRYAGRTDRATQMKMNEEIQQFYQAENFNPAGGCLPMLVELPIIFALYNVITSPLKYLLSWSEEVITAVTEKIAALELQAVNQIDMINIMKSNFAEFADIVPEGFTVDMFPNFHVFGNFLDLSQKPSFSEPSWLLLIPLLTFLASFGSMKLTRKFTYQAPQAQDDQTALSMKIMDFTMPLMSVWISFSVPATIGMYWVYQNILSAGRQMLLYKMYPVPKFTDEDYKRAEQEMNGKLSKTKRKKAQRSLHNIDADDEAPDRQLPEKTESDKADEAEESSVAPAPIKDDNVRLKKKSDTDKPKPRSLHNIDREIPDTPENTLMLDENGRRIRSEKVESESGGNTKDNGVKDDGSAETQNVTDTEKKTDDGTGDK